MFMCHKRYFLARGTKQTIHYIGLFGGGICLAVHYIGRKRVIARGIQYFASTKNSDYFNDPCNDLG